MIGANLEAGGDGAALDGTPYGKQMAVAATGNYKNAYRLGKVSCSEGAALGVNWAFAPVVDIDKNFRNPITNIRTYGNNADKIIEYATNYIKAAKEENVATAIKHFPGDGVNERDQHILTSINRLSRKEWDDSYGRIYSKLIEEGTLSVMVGHIALPSYQLYYNPQDNGKVIPATLSPELLGDLLRKKLKFNGLIITDATPMVGFTSALERRIAIPYAIESGCDMILFNKDLEEDYTFMMDGYKKGILSENRFQEAITRILAMKAALKLHIKQKERKLVPDKAALKILKSEEHIKWARELSDQSITLVKDTQHILPISSQKTKRVLLEVIGNCKSENRIIKKFQHELQLRDFDVTIYKKEDFSKKVDNITMIREKYDLVLYVGNIENESNKTTNRINWYTFFGQGNNIPWFVKEVPTLFISLSNPYHLFDVPMIKTYINCYSNNDFVIESVVGKICGDSTFKGVSPIDPFCGKDELRY